MADTGELGQADWGALAAELIHAARAAGLRPGKMGSAVQFGMLAKSLIDRRRVVLIWPDEATL